MAFQLLLKAFINTIGYPMLQSAQKWFDDVAAEIRNPEVARNLLVWLPRFTPLADDPGGAQIATALDKRVEAAGTLADAPQMMNEDGPDPQV